MYCTWTRRWKILVIPGPDSLLHWLLFSALVMQSNCKPGFTGQLKWVYSCLVSGSCEAADESSTGLLLFLCGESLSPGSLSTELSHGEQSRVIAAVQYNELLWDFQWTPAYPNLIVGAVLLPYKSNPTYWEQIPPCYLPPLQCGLWWGSMLHCWGSYFAMIPTEVSASYLQYRMGLWTLWNGKRTKQVEKPLPILLFSIYFWRRYCLCMEGNSCFCA